jgi:hypothetical protein
MPTSRAERETLYRDVIPHLLTSPDLRVTEAARLLDLSPRQVFRLKAHVRLAGPNGLTHGNRGRPSPHAKPGRLHRRVLGLYRREYRPAGYTYAHFADALAETHGIVLSPATVRRWLLAADLGRKPHRYRHHRRARLRSARRGEMLFLDGSPHRWFGPDQPRATLILVSDDATGEPLYGLFEPHESLNGCFAAFYHTAQRYGLPRCLYLDRAGQFTTTRHEGIHRHQRDDLPTAFEVAMKRLAVKLIFAHSPQARGRAERLNRSFQERLVAEFVLRGIKDRETATAYLNQQFIPRFAQRFAVVPRDPVPAFRPLLQNVDLRMILCRTVSRSVSSDNTIRYRVFRYQLLLPSTCRTLFGSRVEVREWFDESIHVHHPHYGEIANRQIPSDGVLRRMYDGRHQGG